MSLLDGCISYWKMDETSGTRYDSVSDNDLSDNNTVLYAAGKIGNAADLEATNTEYLSSSSQDFSFKDDNFTICCWVKIESDPPTSYVRQILGKWNTSTSNKSYILGTNGPAATSYFRFVASNDGTSANIVNATSFGNFSNGTWYFLVAWHDADNNLIGISVNNTANTAAHTGGLYKDTTSDFRVGWIYDHANSVFDGLIDEVSVWNRVLSSAERAMLYNGGNGCSWLFPATAASATASAVTGTTALKTVPVFATVSALATAGTTALKTAAKYVSATISAVAGSFRKTTPIRVSVPDFYLVAPEPEHELSSGVPQLTAQPVDYLLIAEE